MYPRKRQRQCHIDVEQMIEISTEYWVDFDARLQKAILRKQKHNLRRPRLRSPPPESRIQQLVARARNHTVNRARVLRPEYDRAPCVTYMIQLHQTLGSDRATAGDAVTPGVGSWEPNVIFVAVHVFNQYMCSRSSPGEGFNSPDRLLHVMIASLALGLRATHDVLLDYECRGCHR